MEDLTLIIPAKNEKESLPKVLEELKEFRLKKVIILERTDIKTIEAIKEYDCEILFQHNKGYGDALIQGINHVNTEYFCIFNADGSFNPIELQTMIDKIKSDNFDLIFASRYEKNCSSDDDTMVTLIGNFFFTKLGKFLFGLNVTDILYTFVLGRTLKVRNLNLKSKDFVFCVELPITAKKKGLKIDNSKSNERARFGGVKKVNALKDGLLILIGMLKLFFLK